MRYQIYGGTPLHVSASERERRIRAERQEGLSVFYPESEDPTFIFSPGSFSEAAMQSKQRELEGLSLNNLAEILLASSPSLRSYQWILVGLKDFRDKRFEEAKRSLRNASVCVPGDDEHRNVAAALNVFRAHVHWHDQEYVMAYRIEQALTYYESAFVLWQQAGERALLAEHLSIAAAMCLIAGKIDFAVVHCSRLVSLEMAPSLFHDCTCFHMRLGRMHIETKLIHDCEAYHLNWWSDALVLGPEFIRYCARCRQICLQLVRCLISQA